MRAHEAAWDAVGLSERPLAELAPFEQRVQVFEDSLAQLSDDGHVWLAERDGAILGFVSCTRGGDAAELRDFYVVPEAWRSGMGRALHDKAITWMRERQAVAVLWVAKATRVPAASTSARAGRRKARRARARSAHQSGATG